MKRIIVWGVFASVLLMLIGASDQFALARIRVLGGSPMYGKSMGFREQYGLVFTGKEFDDDALRKAIKVINNSSVNHFWIVLRNTSVSDLGLAELCMLPELGRLTLDGTRIDGKGLSSLSSLVSLHVVVSRKATPNLARLEDDSASLLHLTLGPTGTEIIEKITFQGKNRIWVYGNGLSRTDVEFLSTIPRLERLWLDKNKIDDETLRYVARMESLTHLDISKTPITDAGAQYLAASKTLRSVALHGTQISAEGRDAMRKCGIEIVDLRTRFVGLDGTPSPTMNGVAR
jgi:hypothetical protein